MNRNQSEHEEQKDETRDILWKILHSVEKIDATLIGTPYTNGKGLVHKVEEQGILLEDLDKRVGKIESSFLTEEKIEKKSHSVWGIAASWAAAIVAIIALIFSKK